MRDAVGAYRHVVLVGGTSEIGTAIVTRLIDEGTQAVTLVSRDPEHAETSFPDRRATVRSIGLDLSSPSTYRELAQRCGNSADMDLVIVAVGMLGDADRATHDPIHAAELMNTTFIGPAALTGAFADFLAGQGHGTLVVISSVAGYRVRGDNHVYGAAKAGLDGFAQGLSQRLHGSGVDVLIVRPGFVHTRMTDGMDAAPFSVGAQDVANDVATALRKGSTIAWSPPKLRWVMGIIRHLPSRLFRLIASR